MSRAGAASRPVHGGPDSGPPIAHDFSTNANACGPSPSVWAAVQTAPRQAYPDPAYVALRAQLASHHGVDASRIVLSSGVSEGVRRLSLAWLQRHGARACVLVPQPGYGDYAAAAQALGLPLQAWTDTGHLRTLLAGLAADARPLVWINEPRSPVGDSLPRAAWTPLADAVGRQGGLVALDRAYEPLRLQGDDPVPPEVAARCWAWWSPNKACCMTGVRAAYAIAPSDHRHADLTATFEYLAPSWVIGAEGVALLEASVAPAHVGWLPTQRPVLRDWAAAQAALLASWGWTVRPSVANFMLAHPPLDEAGLQALHATARAQGVKLRDATSFGLPGWLRLGVRGPHEQAALAAVWQGFAAGKIGR